MNTPDPMLRTVRLSAVVVFLITTAGKTGANDLPVQAGKGWQVKARHYRSLNLEALPSSIGEDLDFRADSFVVAGSVAIEEGATVRFAPGARVYAEPGTEIRVRGHLIAEATAGEPVVFTSLPSAHTYVLLEPGDTVWNGIVLEAGGALTLRNVTISKCRDAIRTQAACDSVRLTGVTFSGITGNAVVLRDGPSQVPMHSPFSLLCEEGRSRQASSGKVSPRKIAMTAALGILTAAGAAGIYLADRAAWEYLDKANTAADPDKGSVYIEKSRGAYRTRNALWAATVATGLGFGVALVVGF